MRCAAAGRFSGESKNAVAQPIVDEVIDAGALAEFAATRVDERR